MSLQGTLDTLSLPDLCELLSGTGKTGALHVRAEAGSGVLWFADGKVCAGEAGGQTGPPPPGARALGLSFVTNPSLVPPNTGWKAFFVG